MLDLKAGYTRFPDHILDSMDRFDPVQWKILCLIVRKNCGFKNPTKEFSVRYISAKTGIKKSTVQRHLTMMIQAGTLLVVGRGSRGVLLLDIPMPGPTSGTVDEPVSQAIVTTVPETAAVRTAETVPVPNTVQTNSTDVLVVLKAKLSERTYQEIETAHVGGGVFVGLNDYLGMLVEANGGRIAKAA